MLSVVGHYDKRYTNNDTTMQMRRINREIYVSAKRPMGIRCCSGWVCVCLCNCTVSFVYMNMNFSSFSFLIPLSFRSTIHNWNNNSIDCIMFFCRRIEFVCCVRVDYDVMVVIVMEGSADRVNYGWHNTLYCTIEIALSDSVSVWLADVYTIVYRLRFTISSTIYYLRLVCFPRQTVSIRRRLLRLTGEDWSERSKRCFFLYEIRRIVSFVSLNQRIQSVVFVFRFIDDVMQSHHSTIGWLLLLMMLVLTPSRTHNVCASLRVVYWIGVRCTHIRVAVQCFCLHLHAVVMQMWNDLCDYIFLSLKMQSLFVRSLFASTALQSIHFSYVCVHHMMASNRYVEDFSFSSWIFPIRLFCKYMQKQIHKAGGNLRRTPYDRKMCFNNQ